MSKFFLFIFSFFLLGINQIYANSDVVDFLSGSTKTTYNINYVGCSTSNCFLTGTIAVSPPVYLKNIICKSGNNNDPAYVYSTGSILTLTISPNSNLSGNYHNIALAQGGWPRTDQFDLDYVYTGTGLYWKVLNTLNTGSWVNVFPSMLCYLNGVKYDPLLIPTYSSNSWGSSSDFYLSSTGSYTHIIPSSSWVTLGAVVLDVRELLQWFLVFFVSFCFTLLIIWYLWKK